ncbi:MAG: PKD domain-containing protein [Thermoproteota archaeon]|nr:PKD domain-containing protein [Thermoproteota archaeon]
MSKTAKMAIVFGAIGAIVGIGATITILYNQPMGSMLQGLAGGESNYDNSNYYSNNQDNTVAKLGFITHYKAILAVGEEGAYSADSKFAKGPGSFEWKFGDGLTLNGQNVTRTFDTPGRYSFYLTVTDANGDKVTSTELYTDVVQKIVRKEGNGNITR